MKTTLKIAALALTLGMGQQGITLLQAEDKGTVTEESRMSSDRETPSMKSMDEFTTLKKGDKIQIFSKNDKGSTTVITSVDEKGVAKWTTTKNGSQLDGSNLVLKKKDNSREVETLWLQSDGTLTPVEVRRAK